MRPAPRSAGAAARTSWVTPPAATWPSSSPSASRKVRTLALFAATPGLKHSLRRPGSRASRRWASSGSSPKRSTSVSTRGPTRARRWFIEQAGSNDPAFIGRFVLHMCTHDFMEELRAIGAPTLIVAAGKEPIGQPAPIGRCTSGSRAPNCASSTRPATTSAMAMLAGASTCLRISCKGGAEQSCAHSCYCRFLQRGTQPMKSRKL